MLAKTRNDAAMDENDVRHPSKAARTILTVLNQVKITSQLHIQLILFDYLSYPKLHRMPDRRTAIDRRPIADKSVSKTILRCPSG
jgi:hypothetical protein